MLALLQVMLLGTASLVESPRPNVADHGSYRTVSVSDQMGHTDLQQHVLTHASSNYTIVTLC